MKILLAIAILGLAASCRAQGGPPMITDDPDTVGNRNWEINVADVASFSRTERVDLAPYLDINYGVGDRIQLKVEGGYGTDQIYGQRSQSGLGPLLTGVRWKYWDQEKDGKLSASMYPQFGSHAVVTSRDAGIAPAGNYWLLPMQFSKRWGPLALVSDIGYQYQTRNADSCYGGLLFAWEPRKDFELLAELHGDVAARGGDGDLIVNFGTRVPLSAKALIIASVGHTVKTLADADSQPLSYLPGAQSQWLTYLGMQFRL